MVKSTVEISQNFVAFSEYMNFMNKKISIHTFFSPKSYQQPNLVIALCPSFWKVNRQGNINEYLIPYGTIKFRKWKKENRFRS